MDRQQKGQAATQADSYESRRIKRGQATSGWKNIKRGKLLKRERRIRKMQQQVQTRRGKATTISRQQWGRCTIGDRQQQWQAYNSGQATSGERQ